MNSNVMAAREDLTKDYIEKLIEQYQNPSSETQRERARDKLAQARRIASGDPDALWVHLWILKAGIDLEEVAFAEPEAKKKRGYG